MKIQDSESTLLSAKSLEPEFQQYGYRWVILLLFGIPNILSAVMWITFAPISSQVQEAYSVSSFEVSMCSSVYMIVYAFVDSPANYILDTYGIRPGIAIGTVLTVAGSVIRILIDQHFYFAILGQTFAGLGQPFLLNAPSKIASVWFIARDRPMATSLLSTINLMGASAGFLMPGLVVGDDATHYREKIKSMLIMVALILGPLNLITLVFLRNKPPTPPSLTASVDRMPFKESFKRLFKNPDYLLLMFMYSVVLGNFSSFSTVLQGVIEPYGYSDVDSSILGSALVGVGVVAALVFSHIVEKYQNYRTLLIVCCTGLVLTMAWLMVALHWNMGMVWVGVGIVGQGLFMIAAWPITFELACEIAFPVGEAVCVGLFMTSGQIVAIIQLFSYGVFDSYTTTSSMVIMGVTGGCNVLALGAVLAVTQTLRRAMNEQNSTFRSTF